MDGVIAWGTPHQFFRAEPDFTPLLVLALSLAIPFLVLRVRPTPFTVLLSLLIGFSWLAVSRALGTLVPSLLVIILLAGMAMRRAGRPPI
jgi:hypothetical protein